MKTARARCAAALLCGLQFTLPAQAAPLQFALLAKRLDNPFFRLAGAGCAEAAEARGDRCLLLGAPGPAHFRLQNEALEQALERDLDGIALAVIHSKWLAAHALQHLGKTPLITFDSDLEPAERHLRRGYVGIDNLAFGHQLGLIVQHLRPQGGTLCVLNSSAQEPNLQARLQGLRQQLRGDKSHTPGDERLNGENGWHELERCPLYSASDQQSALFQLATLLDSTPVDTLVSLGGWPTHRASEFRRQLGPLLTALATKGRRPTIVIPTAELDAEQRALLDDGLVQAFLSMETREIGRQSYWMMKRLAQGLEVPERILVKTHAYLPTAPLPGNLPP